MQLHELKPTTPRKTAKRIGRGGKRGKTAGRGTKGQTARAGNSTRPEMRELIKKLPKLRGYGVNRAQTVNNERVLALPVNLSVLEMTFATGDTISPSLLVTKGIIKRVGKKVPKIKILGTGTLTKKFIIQGCTLSASAKEKIVAVGGTVTS